MMTKFMLTLAFAVLPSMAAAEGALAQSKPAISWSGCYVGVGGSRMANETSTFAFNTYDGGFHSANGGMFQIRAGCDVQQGQFVFGVLGTIDSGNIQGRNAFFPVGQDFPEYLTTDVHWTGALKARVGAVIGEGVLIYGSAGPAWERISYSDYDEVPVLSFEGLGEEIRQGYQVGLGAEIQVNERLRVFLEYAYSDFGSADVTLIDSNPSTVTDGTPWSNRYTIKAQMITVGFSYKF
jgi:outer membrane immunogenic protein